jgi:hypothetical protein
VRASESTRYPGQHEQPLGFRGEEELIGCLTVEGGFDSITVAHAPPEAMLRLLPDGEGELSVEMAQEN